MRIETDPRVVAKLAEEREDANWQLRAFLKFVDLEINELDVIVHRHYEEVANQVDCCSCGNCCRHVTPILQEHDIDRLATGLDVSRKEMADRFFVTDEDGDVIFREMPCPFLLDSFCTVYEHRPDDCRSFPHLDKGEFVFRLTQAVQNCSICPIVFNVFERLKDELWHKPDGGWDEDVNRDEAAEQAGSGDA